MAKRQQVLAMRELEWSLRRIEAKTGARHETISRYDASRPGRAVKVFEGSAPSQTDSPEEAVPVAPANAAEVFPGSPSNPAKVFAGTEAARPRATALNGRYVLAIDPPRGHVEGQTTPAIILADGGSLQEVCNLYRR